MNGVTTLQTTTGEVLAEFPLAPHGVFDEAGALVASAGARPIVVSGHKCYGSWPTKPIIV